MVFEKPQIGGRLRCSCRLSPNGRARTRNPTNSDPTNSRLPVTAANFGVFHLPSFPSSLVFYHYVNAHAYAGRGLGLSPFPVRFFVPLLLRAGDKLMLIRRSDKPPQIVDVSNIFSTGVARCGKILPRTLNHSFFLLHVCNSRVFVQ